eukprot:149936_1
MFENNLWTQIVTTCIQQNTCKFSCIYTVVILLKCTALHFFFFQSLPEIMNIDMNSRNRLWHHTETQFLTLAIIDKRFMSTAKPELKRTTYFITQNRNHKTEEELA